MRFWLLAVLVLLKAFLRHCLCHYLQYRIVLSFAHQNYFVTSILFTKATIINQFNIMRLKKPQNLHTLGKIVFIILLNFPITIVVKMVNKAIGEMVF